jgi:hypothetical protein
MRSLNCFRLFMKARMVRAGRQVPNERSKWQKSKSKLTSIASRDEGNGKRPATNENKGERGVPGGGRAAEILEDVEPVTGNDIFWCTKGNRVRMS